MLSRPPPDPARQRPVVDPSRDLDIRRRRADRRRRRSATPSAASARPACRKAPRSSTAAASIVAPGLVDMRAFVGEPGAEHRETLASASQAAAAGGVTTIVCQPDTDPAIDDPAIVDFILRRARDTGDRPRPSDGGADQGPRGPGDDRDRPAQGGRRRRLHRRRHERHQRAGDAPRADLRRATSTR